MKKIKLDRSAIMKKAHELYKEMQYTIYLPTFGACLEAVWKVYREEVAK